MGLFDLSDILPLSKFLFGETPSVYDVIDFVDTVTMESELTDEKRSFYEKATEKYKEAYTYFR